jgi:hypothetical protein
MGNPCYVALPQYKALSPKDIIKASVCLPDEDAGLLRHFPF